MRSDLPDSGIYSEDYFLSPACEGLCDYLSGTLSMVRERQLQLLEAHVGHRVLDLGCGRGDVISELNQRGVCTVGIDYSSDSIRLTKKVTGDEAVIVRADAAALPDELWFTPARLHGSSHS